MISIIGSCIKYQMDLEGIRSQAELSQKSGVSAGVLSSIMTGKTGHPDVWTIAKIAEALRCPLDRLVYPNAEMVNALTSREQRIIDCYRNGPRKYRRGIDLIAEWDEEDRPNSICRSCGAPASSGRHWGWCDHAKAGTKNPRGETISEKTIRKASR